MTIQPSNTKDKETYLYTPKTAKEIGISTVLYRIPESKREYVERILREFLFRTGGASKATAPLFSSDPEYPLNLRWQRIFAYLFEEGLITEPRVIFERIFRGEAPFYSLRLRAAPLYKHTDGVVYRKSGFSRGMSTDLDEALGKAIGEFLERYPQLLYRDNELYRGSVKTLRESHTAFLNPAHFRSYSKEQYKQFPEFNFDDDSVFRWTEGRKLQDGQRVLIPAQMVYLNYRMMEGEPNIRDRNTSGAAGMFSEDDAILHGLYELIQRDAFFLYWLSGKTPPRVDPRTIQHPQMRSLLKHFKKQGIEAYTLYLPTDIPIPTFVTVLVDRSSEGPAFVLGSGTGVDLEAAILSSCHEALGVRHWLLQRRDKWAEHAALPRAPFSERVGADRRILMWANDALLPHGLFMLKGKELPLKTIRKRYEAFATTAKQKSADRLSFLCDFLPKLNLEHEIVVYTAQHPALSKLGYASVKVFVPGLIPLYFNEKHAPLGSSRLRNFSKDVNKRAANIIPNAIPHPFP